MVAWTPDSLGERIYRKWTGNNNATVDPRSQHYKSCHWAIAVFSGDFTMSVSASTGKPMPLVQKSGSTLIAQWARTTNDLNEIEVTGVPSGTHLVISHRRNGVHYLRYDGVDYGPVGTDIVCPQPRGQSPVGQIIYNGPLAMIGSGDGLTDTEVLKIEGWARVNHGVSLPGGHAYASTTPQIEAGDWDDTLEIRPTQAEWNAMVYTEANKNDPVPSSALAWPQTWAAQFDNGVRIGEEWESPSGLDFFARVHGAGVQQAKAVNLTPLADDGNPHYHYLNWNGEDCLRGRMEDTDLGSTGSTVRAPIYCSVNQAGMGHAFAPPFFARCRFALHSGDDPQAVGDFTFPAWWIKDTWEFIYPFFNNFEWDIMEGRSNLPEHMSTTLHYHKPPQETDVGPNGDDNFRGSFPHTKTNADTDGIEQYDAEFHEWACLMDEDFIIHYVGPGDGTLKEVSRCPNHPSLMQREWYFLVDMALRNGASNLAAFEAAGVPCDITISAMTVQQPVEGVNNPATGSPVITGPVEIAGDLFANTDGIADADGLGTFNYQWQSSPNGTGSWTNLATGAFFTLTANEANEYIRVIVSFTDQLGNPESVTSSAVGPVPGEEGPVADVTVLAATNSYLQEVRGAGMIGPYWVSSSTGYIAVVDNEGTDDRGSHVYKTTDSGATWAEQDAGNSPAEDNNLRPVATAWDEGGDQILFSWAYQNNDDVFFRAFSTATDTWGSRVTIDSSGPNVASGLATSHLSICRAAGGNIYVALTADRTLAGAHEAWLSDDNGATWSNMADPLADGDFIWLAPDDNAADADDIIGIYYDESTKVISRVLYDASADSWGSPTTITTITNSAESVPGRSWLGWEKRNSDGAIIVGVWNDYDTATADLEVHEVLASGITALTNVVSNSDDCAWVGLFIDQNRDDLYCAYAGSEAGDETLEATVQVYYKVSTDDGATWSSETAYSVENDDIRMISGGGMKSNTTGRFMPVWFNDDTSEYRVNDGNDVEITVPSATEALNGTADVAFGNSVALTATGELNAAPAIAISGTSAPSATGQLAGSGDLTFDGSAVPDTNFSLNGTAPLALSGTAAPSASGDLAGSASVAFSGSSVASQVGALNGLAGFSAGFDVTAIMVDSVGAMAGSGAMAFGGSLRSSEFIGGNQSARNRKMLMGFNRMMGLG